MRRTKKQIKEEIKSIQKQIKDLSSYDNIPGYNSLQVKLQDMREDYNTRTSSKKEVLWDKESTLYKELKDWDEARKIKLTPDAEQLLWDLKSGVDYGYGGIHISYLDPDNRFAIITNPGSTAGQGTAMGTGGYHYSSTQHWISFMGEGGYHDNNQHFEIEGRLTRLLRQELVGKAIQHLNEKTKQKSL